MKQHPFITALEGELKARYPWARSDVEKLNRFLYHARYTMACCKTEGCDRDMSIELSGDAVKAAWRQCGGKGRPTYSGLYRMFHDWQESASNPES